ncbi:ETC complex I subunit [Falsirhodobacter halotolerans]|uniref:ETC complex I subunit n=1 Tax=Falsirhodobacter halotolerans TaxID=1146892 RepID=UPI001FD25B9F|nr:ETC complex I subunit [Falsirhodobacter halotolerans]MCJ8139981.1 ETC complex I subunit [Falsirhodobacter halotolerans]
MRARIYKPAKTAMQSGQAKTKQWVLDYAPETAREIDPLMGWTSSDDTQRQVRLRFDTCEAAETYARENGIEVEVQPEQIRKPNIRPGGYGDNFSTTRKGPWTH